MSKSGEIKTEDSGYVSFHEETKVTEDKDKKSDVDQVTVNNWKKFLKEAFTPDEDGDTYLIIYLRQKNLQEAKKLINLNCYFGKKENLDIQNKKKFSAMRLALSKPEIFRILIKAGADLTLSDGIGQNILHHIAEHHYTDALKIILLDGEKDKVKQLMNTTNLAGYTPYFLALQSQYAEMCCYMSANSFVNSKVTDPKNGNTALHEAVTICKLNERLRIIISLVKKCDISPNSPNNCGVTPLHLAASANDREVCATLLALGADCSLRDIHNMLPLSYTTNREIRQKLSVRRV